MIALAATPPGQLFAILTFAKLELRRALRNRRYLGLAIVLPVGLYALYTGVLKADKGAAIGGVPWPAYFMVSMAAYGVMYASLGWSRVIATERSNGWTTQLRVTPLPPAVYVVTKLVVSFVTTVPALGLVLLAAVAFDRVSVPAGTLVAVAVALVVGSVPFAVLGILIGYLFDADSVHGAMIVTYFAMAILGGLFAPVQSFPSMLVTIAQALPSYHLANLGWQLLGGHAPAITDVAVLAAYAVTGGALVAWRYRVEERRGGA